MHLWYCLSRFPLIALPRCLLPDITIKLSFLEFLWMNSFLIMIPESVFSCGHVTTCNQFFACGYCFYSLLRCQHKNCFIWNLLPPLLLNEVVVIGAPSIWLRLEILVNYVKCARHTNSVGSIGIYCWHSNKAVLVVPPFWWQQPGSCS